ncbi:hypothetical protein BRC64_12745 [Halobacteriales archaeon QH_10_67_22]|nr:MAG: hypothetical protein BRC64_12745 [Halobacteriales archaeon QH_10_67_22]
MSKQISRSGYASIRVRRADTLIGVEAGYHNQLLVDGTVAVPDTRPYNDDPSKLPKTLDAPAVSCPSN